MTCFVMGTLSFCWEASFLAQQSRLHAAYDKDFFGYQVWCVYCGGGSGLFFDGYFKGGFFFSDGAFEDFNGFFDSLPLRSPCRSRPWTCL